MTTPLEFDNSRTVLHTAGAAKPERWRKVKYRGCNIEIPLNCRYVATDKNGAIYAYENRPQLNELGGMWTVDSGKVCEVMRPTYGWTDSIEAYMIAESGDMQANRIEPKSVRAKDFADWWDVHEYADEDFANPIGFDINYPKSVVSHVYAVTGLTLNEIRNAVINHIDSYTVPQYGDYPDDSIESWTQEMCLAAANKYKAREGKSQRDEGNLDYWKMLHYLQLAQSKRG